MSVRRCRRGRGRECTYARPEIPRRDDAAREASGSLVRFVRLARFVRIIRIVCACPTRTRRPTRQRETPEGADGRDGRAADHERGCARERECYLTCVTVARDAASRPRMEGRQASAAVCMDVPAHGRGRVRAPVAFVAEIWRVCWMWIKVWSFLEFGVWESGR